MPLTDTYYRILRLIIDNAELQLNEDNCLAVIASNLSLSLEITRAGLVRLEKDGLIVRSGASTKLYVPTGLGRGQIQQD